MSPCCVWGKPRAWEEAEADELPPQSLFSYDVYDEAVAVMDEDKLKARGWRWDVIDKVMVTGSSMESVAEAAPYHRQKRDYEVPDSSGGVDPPHETSSPKSDHGKEWNVEDMKSNMETLLGVEGLDWRYGCLS